MLDTLSDDDRALLIVALAGYWVTAPSQKDKQACRALMTRAISARSIILHRQANPVVEE